MAVADPMDSAVKDAESAAQFFGKLDISAQFVILRKGQQKTTWHEGMDMDGRTTEVSIRLNPLDCTGMTRMIERQVISNSGEWSKTVWPSLRDLGVKALKEIHGKWAHVAMVPNGRSWANKEGQTVTGSTFRFIKLFDLKSDAVKEWEAQFGGSQAHTPSGNGTNGNGAASQAVSQANDAEKAVAAQFLPALVKGAKGDLVELSKTLASMSPVNRYFDINSPEVQQLLKVAA
jgi:hypothetical protein